MSGGMCNWNCWKAKLGKVQWRNQHLCPCMCSCPVLDHLFQQWCFGHPTQEQCDKLNKLSWCLFLTHACFASQQVEVMLMMTCCSFLSNQREGDATRFGANTMQNKWLMLVRFRSFNWQASFQWWWLKHEEIQAQLSNDCSRSTRRRTCLRDLPVLLWQISSTGIVIARQQCWCWCSSRVFMHSDSPFLQDAICCRCTHLPMWLTLLPAAHSLPSTIPS